MRTPMRRATGTASSGTAAPGAEAFSSAPLTALVGFTLRMAQIKTFEDFNARMNRLRLRPSDYAVLVLIGTNPGCRASQVAAVLSIKRPNFVALLAALEARSLVTRQRSLRDKRVFHLELTPDGRALLDKADRLVAAQEEQIGTILGADGKAGLIAMLRRLLGASFQDPPLDPNSGRTS